MDAEDIKLQTDVADELAERVSQASSERDMKNFRWISSLMRQRRSTISQRTSMRVKETLLSPHRRTQRRRPRAVAAERGGVWRGVMLSGNRVSPRNTLYQRAPAGSSA